MPQPEADLARKCVDWLNKQPRTLARKKHGTQFGMKGDPDIYGVIDGRAFAIELKIGKNSPTTLQEKRLKEWGDAGAIVGVAWSLDDVKEIVDELYRDSAFKL